MYVTATPGKKMQFLISRRSGVTRDELVVNWFSNHMPAVLARQKQTVAAADAIDPRYIATLYDPVPAGEQVWDGVAQIWTDAPFPREKTPHGTTPRDTFQQKAEPYVGWPTTEYVIVDGDLPLTPNDLNEQIIFQDPFASLDPRRSVGYTVGEPLIVHGKASKGSELDDRVGQLFERVGLEREHMLQFPISSPAGSVSGCVSRGRWPSSRSW